jgi:hypothetical protein
LFGLAFKKHLVTGLFEAGGLQQLCHENHLCCWVEGRAEHEGTSVDAEEFRNSGEDDRASADCQLWHPDFRMMASVILVPCLLDETSLHSSCPAILRLAKL